MWDAAASGDLKVVKKYIEDDGEDVDKPDKEVSVGIDTESIPPYQTATPVPVP